MKKIKIKKIPNAKKMAVHKRLSLFAVAGVMAIVIPLQILDSNKTASADDYDSQIKALQSQIDQYTATASQLKSQADTLQSKVDELVRQQAVIQTQIDLATAQYNQLVEKIATTKKQIEATKSALGDVIADLYIDGKTTPLEMVASSNNLSDYFDKQTQQESVSSSLGDKITQIKQLQKDLEKQEQEQKIVIQNNEKAKAALEASKQEQQKILNETRGQEDSYRSLTESAKTKKLQVQEAQQQAIQAAMRAAAAAAGSSGSGGFIIAGGSTNYPWNGSNCYVDENAYSHGGIGGGEDGWGYGCRQCASYAAWMVGQKTGKIPYGWGNANNFPANARAAGFGTGSAPRANSLGVISAGQYGHVVYVESVNGDGSVNISQYNYYNAGGPGWGNFSRMTVPSGTYDTYIYL